MLVIFLEHKLNHKMNKTLQGTDGVRGYIVSRKTWTKKPTKNFFRKKYSYSRIF